MPRPVSRARLTAYRLAGLLGAALWGWGCVPPTPSNDLLKVGSIEVFGNASVQVGASIVLHTLVKTPSGSTIPSSDAGVTWTSSKSTVADVDASGVVTGRSPGEADIIAGSGGVTGTKKITVTAAPQVPVASVTVTGPGGMFSGDKILLLAETRDANNNQLVGRNVVWTSSNPGVASVNLGSGEVTGVSQGYATITATSEGKSDTHDVTVRWHIFRIEITGPTAVRVGESIQLFAAAFAFPSFPVLDPDFTWQSADPGKATVSANGLVTGVATGTATISAASDDKSMPVQITVMAASAPAVLQGRVIDFVTQNGISGASVLFYAGSQQVGSTTTDASGDFSSAPLLIPAGGLIMEAYAPSYVPGRVLVDRGQSSATVYTEPIPLVRDAANGFISGVVKNARTGAGIGGATVQVFDNVSASPRIQITSNNDGTFSTSALPSGTYRMVGSATGYQNTQRVGVVVGNSAETPGQDLVLSPSGTNDVRIVLTWGASPFDLDSHLTGPNTDATRFHVYFSNPGGLTGAPFAFLDIDDTNRFGPETITISQMNSGVYRYTVHDFDNRNSTTSSALGTSGAKVQVYNPGGLIQTFFVPHAAGNLWTVFEMTGTLQNPVITPKDIMGFTNCAGCITAPPAVVAPQGAAADADAIGRAVRRGGKGLTRIRR
jgi:uncharacterized protein YjdB